MSSYDVSVPLTRFKELEEIEKKYKNEFVTVQKETDYTNNYNIQIYISGKLSVGTIITKEQRNNPLYGFYSESERIKELVENTIKNEYRVFEIEFKQKVIMEYEDKLKKLSFFEKFLELFRS